MIPRKTSAIEMLIIHNCLELAISVKNQIIKLPKSARKAFYSSEDKTLENIYHKIQTSEAELNVAESAIMGILLQDFLIITKAFEHIDLEIFAQLDKSFYEIFKKESQRIIKKQTVIEKTIEKFKNVIAKVNEDKK